MFSRLYQSARAIFTDSEGTTRSAPPTSTPREETMVTTRQRDSQISAGDRLEEEDSINVYVPTSSSKIQRSRSKRTSSSEEDEGEAEYAPPGSRKRKRLPVRAKDAESPDPGRTRPVVEIPVKKISPAPDHTTAVAREEEGEGAEEEEEHTNEESRGDVAEYTEPIVTKQHIRFGSEEVADDFSTAREVAFNDEANSKTYEDPRVIQDSDESGDDAPEAVGIQEAAKTVKLKDKEAVRAVKDQLSASRKKRKERNEAMKQQAESSRKRKLEDKKNEDRTKKAKHSAEGDEVLSTKENQKLYEDQNDGVAEEATNRKDTSKLLALSKRALPEILPAEYLEEDAEPEDLLPFDQFPIKKAKKTKFHLVAEKEPKDRRVGSTTYRVAKASNKNLAPKSSLQARNMKDSWLQGRSGKATGTNRTSFTKGFFKK